MAFVLNKDQVVRIGRMLDAFESGQLFPTRGAPKGHVTREGPAFLLARCDGNILGRDPVDPEIPEDEQPPAVAIKGRCTVLRVDQENELGDGTDWVVDAYNCGHEQLNSGEHVALFREQVTGKYIVVCLGD